MTHPIGALLYRPECMRRVWDRVRLAAWLWFVCQVWIPWLFVKRRWRDRQGDDGGKSDKTAS